MVCSGPGPLCPGKAHGNDYQLVPQSPGLLLVCPVLHRVRVMGILAPCLGVSPTASS